jgi:HEPN domain-containing protein
MSASADVIALVRQWVAKAEEDLRTAEHTLTLKRRCPFATVCFHAQQCIEKYLKALLASLSIDFPKIHDLAELVALLPAGYTIPLTRADAKEAIALARAARRAVRGYLAKDAVT